MSKPQLALLEVDMYNKFGGHPHILKMYDSAIVPSTRRPGAEEVLLLLEFYPVRANKLIRADPSGTLETPGSPTVSANALKFNHNVFYCYREALCKI